MLNKMAECGGAEEKSASRHSCVVTLLSLPRLRDGLSPTMYRRLGTRRLTLGGKRATPVIRGGAAARADEALNPIGNRKLL